MMTPHEKSGALRYVEAASRLGAPSGHTSGEFLLELAARGIRYPGPDCIEPEQMDLLANGDDPGFSAAADAHIQGCLSCQAAIAFAMKQVRTETVDLARSVVLSGYLAGQVSGHKPQDALEIEFAAAGGTAPPEVVSQLAAALEQALAAGQSSDGTNELVRSVLELVSGETVRPGVPVYEAVDAIVVTEPLRKLLQASLTRDALSHNRGVPPDHFAALVAVRLRGGDLPAAQVRAALLSLGIEG